MAGSNDATKELTYSALQLFVFGDKKDTTEAISNNSADIASWGRDSSIVVAAQPSTPHQVDARMDATMATMQVTVPQGAQSGQAIVVQTQSGIMHQVIIPSGLFPGQTFLIQVPSTTTQTCEGVVVQGTLTASSSAAAQAANALLQGTSFKCFCQLVKKEDKSDTNYFVKDVTELTEQEVIAHEQKFMVSVQERMITVTSKYCPHCLSDKDGNCPTGKMSKSAQ